MFCKELNFYRYFLKSMVRAIIFYLYLCIIKNMRNIIIIVNLLVLVVLNKPR